MAVSGLDRAMSVNASAILAYDQRHQIQVVATATSTVSITASLFAIYWFCLMRRNFRRDLVLLLIMGDFWKSFVYLLYATATFARGQLQTTSGFCQVGGYMLTAGIEACDIAILLMGLHMSLQIFPPSRPFLARMLGHDGLYRIRYWVFAAWFIIPNIMTSLAFLNHGPAFQAAGAFCYLPIRPYWYRLALSWIPRYLIWIFVMGVAIRIYRHVGNEFQVFGQEKDRTTSLNMPGESSVNRALATQALVSARRKSMAQAAAVDLEKQDSEESAAPGDTSTLRRKSLGESRHSQPDCSLSMSYTASRRPSAPGWSAAFAFPIEQPPAGSQSAANSRRGSYQIASGVQAEDFAAGPSPADLARHRPSVVTLASIMSSTAPSFTSIPVLPPIQEDKRTSASFGSTSARNAVTNVVQNRRQAIQRQLRLLFIYPVTYIIIWIIPFINHSFNYSDYYAQHPFFVLNVLNTFCQCFLGFADVCVFCWREKPWRHVPGSDGTFLGSFCFWRFWRTENFVRRLSKAPSDVPDDRQAGDAEKNSSQAGLLNVVKRWSQRRTDSNSTRQTQSAGSVDGSSRARPLSHRRTQSGGSDRKHLEFEHAHQRLALERAEWQANARNLEQRREGLDGLPQVPSPTRKEWWDGQLDFESSVDGRVGEDTRHEGS
ncbi:G protein-coupled receptor gpr1 [Friedmanniomyces endolithicus]|uniref:G protein-coupled receptor gpr1 n=2 Tax=Friedmanniomyces endolithicus TaxID=329885 RepID=A0AAN6FK94_9PEZI|nr:G protein-coupled receptor gpr1 [Friedmanniomyces endolithicus]KAK0319986.1 G protein-coupled receptor gpr1 [Friedmanniomyces endolithicus]KAK0919349.1 G protein-coupled receptor gpr1 [Friedmanniomyces endolithicus]KAK0961981.1 G protein-coupled receptor gpr1 [Friedmanniomyces endolithicus]